MSREAVLGRIRAALAADESSAVARSDSYPRRGTLSPGERLSLLEERLHEYDSRVFHCHARELRETIAAILTANAKLKMVYPAGVPSQWLDAAINWTSDAGQLSYTEIEEFDGVLSGASVAIAESGSIVLQHGPAEGRRALTLVPDYHLCVLFENQVVETLPESFDRLKESATRPTTFISGPSATADIEMTRIKGVHGPRFLDVLLVA